MLNLPTIKHWRLTAIFIALFFIFGGFFSAIKAENSSVSGDIDQIIRELNDSISSMQAKTKELQEQQKIYEENAKKESGKALSLKNELSILNNSIAGTENMIATYEIQIRKSQLEIGDLESKIGGKENEIVDYRGKIGEFIRQINLEDQKSYLEILMTNDSLSAFFEQINYLKNFQNKLEDALKRMQFDKKDLESQQVNLRGKKEYLEKTQASLEDKNARLDADKTVKNSLLSQTQGQEKKFRSLAEKIRREVADINSEVIKLEDEARKKMAEKMAREGTRENFGAIGQPPFSWPVPLKKITTYFHDSDYPYKNIIGEHTGLDLRAAQGTVVQAAASGYVAKAQNGGKTGYSYVLLVHDDGFSTLYGHLSRLDVKTDDYVVRGQPIGLSGGLPGTPGAGSFSTGPHLHFEVRLNSVPVNPLDYLIKI